MNDEQLQRLLTVVALSTEDESGEMFCDQTQDYLAAYVEAELAGENAATMYPDLAYHLQFCPECFETYQLLREALQDTSPLPDVRPDMSRLPARPAPSVAPPITWAERIARWKTRVPQAVRATRGSATKGGPHRPATNSIEIDVNLPDLDPSTILELWLKDDDDERTLQGSFQPFQRSLRGRKLYLHELDNMEQVTTTAIGRLGDVDFGAVPPDTYFLTIEEPDDDINETPLRILDPAFWGEAA